MRVSSHPATARRAVAATRRQRPAGDRPATRPATTAAAAPQQTTRTVTAAPAAAPAPAAAAAKKVTRAPPPPPPPTADRRDIIWVSAEVYPFSSSGGLGFVSGALPVTLAARGHTVTVVAPKYGGDAYDGVEFSGVTVDVLGTTVGFHTLFKDGVNYVFVDHPSFPRPGGFYADAHGAYGDNHFRFALLARAALEVPLLVPLPNRPPGDAAVIGGRAQTDDGAPGPVFVANDWHAALLPVYLASIMRRHGTLTRARALLAIHNARHQGVYSPRVFRELGIPGDWYGALEWQYPPHRRAGSYEEEGRAVNFLKAGVAVADRVVTVSPRHAHEITTPEGGWDLDGLLASRRPVLNGVLNGIGPEWMPDADPFLAAAPGYANFDASNLAGKAACKAALQAEVGLPVNPDAPLCVFIGRLDFQKAADMVLTAAGLIAARGGQLIMLGSGDAGLEMGLRSLEHLFPDAARGIVGFDVALSHRINAGADIFLMPSRFEPCGTAQLAACGAGTVPVVHETGGLADTVRTFDPAAPEGTNGWTFAPCDQPSFERALGYALDTYADKPTWAALVQRCMACDFSWDKSAAEWEQTFGWALIDPPYAK